MLVIDVGYHTEGHFVLVSPDDDFDDLTEQASIFFEEIDSPDVLSEFVETVVAVF